MSFQSHFRLTDAKLLRSSVTWGAVAWLVAAAAAPEVVLAQESIELGADQVEVAPVDTQSLSDAASQWTEGASPGSELEVDPGKLRADKSIRDLRDVFSSGEDSEQEGDGKEPASLPTGEAKSGVTSSAISAPKGAGTIQGMGESFSASQSTGQLSYSVPFVLPEARGASQPSLGLSYSSAGGFGLAGVGWSVGAPFIARETDHGLPKYDDRPSWHPDQDHFVYSGGQELVPICRVGFDCDGRVLADEEFPAWANGSQYFRPRIEGSFERFFLAEDKLTWRVQSQSGTVLEFGVPLNDRNYRNALEVNPDRPTEIYRWCLVRSYDAFGNANPSTPTAVPTPNNPVVYRYEQFGGIAHLTAIYDTPPVADPHTANLELFAHKVELTWQDRPDTSYSYRSGWYMEHLKRLEGVAVYSKTFNGGPSDAFERIRRYYLTYEDQDGDADNPHQSLLTGVQAEGRCDANGCPRLPEMTFEYERVEGYNTSGAADPTSIPGYEPFDARIRTIAGSPKYSVDQTLTDLFDINSDALPDILVTAPGLFGGKHGVFFNGAGTGGLDVGFFSQSTMSVSDPDVPAVDANVLGLDNSNVVPMDLDADGTVDLVHMPRVKSYSIFTPKYVQGQGWQWDGRPIATADQQDPKIDFANDNANIRSVDVDYDGLVDIVVTTATEIQTFFSLGRFPGGDGQFGTGTWTSASTADLSTDPVRTCVPWSGSPVRFSDSDIRLADMNGDGAVDIVRIRPNDIRYWPGRGNGYWGTGDRDDCGPGSFGQDRHITISNPPQYGLVGDGLLMLDDVNGDGLTDVVEVKNSDVDVYLNIDGLAFTDRQTIAHTPVKPDTSNRVRLVDINGSGTRDILWGDGYEYKFMDLQGGQRPWVLTAVENGLGKRTEMEWSTSVDEMLDAEHDPSRPKWERGMPIVVHVLKRIHERTPLSIVGQPPTHYVSEYSYEDPVFDGQQREFRGFKRGRQTRVGDANSPTDTVETTFLLGECVDDDASDGVDRCGPEGRWLENPREALKGLPVVTESYDEKGVYLRTQVTSYRLRTLYEGVDGRSVKWAYANENHSFNYDTSPFTPNASATRSVPVVDIEQGAGVEVEQTLVVPLRSTLGMVHLSGFNVVDDYGNPTLAVSLGCIEGCDPEESLETHTEWYLPPQDASRWQRRARHSYVTGSQHPERRNEVWTEHDEKALSVRTTAALWGSEPLLRYHEDPAQDAIVKAAVPPNASGGVGTTDIIEVERRTYDDFGNHLRVIERNGRCSEASYDSTYAEFAITDTIFVNGCDSADPLVFGAAYDRGLQVPLLIVNVQGEPSRSEYDGLGRLLSTTPPAPTGGLSPLPTLVMEYFLPPETGKPYSLIHTRVLDGATPSDPEYMESWAYVDGMGRPFLALAEADPAAGDKGEWIAGGLMERDQKNGARRSYLPFFYSGDPRAFPFENVPDVPFGRKRYDAFGRGTQYYDQDGTVTLETKYHALSSDHYDAADRLPGPHQGTFMTEEIDGHGRKARVVERFHQKGVLRRRVTESEFLPTGEVERITRRLDGVPGAETTRWMRFDSLGRLVLNMEPTTGPDFTPDKAADVTGLRAWRYRFNDAGDLVGTSDPRGCGSNFHYDQAGRLIGEDYVPCQNSHPPYSPPVSDEVPTGFEVYTLFDAAPGTPFPGVTRPIPAADLNPAYYRGRPAAVFDRGAARWATYDARGRSPKSYVQIARPDASPNATISERYAPRWYTTEATFDGADRVVSATTGARSPDLLGADGHSRVDTHYTRRGVVQRLDGSYGLLTHGAIFEADGRLSRVQYGDAADTRTSFLYDERRRVRSVQTYRGPPTIWDSYADPDTDPDRQNPTSFQLLLQDTDYQYDVVGNPTEIRDWRLPEEWPGGAQPVTQKIAYDDLYRATRVDYQHPQGSDTWTSPFEHENGGDGDDTRRAKPAPHTAFDTRAEWQTYEFDWLGNITKSEDDGHGFYDRSLGVQQHGNVAAQPYQLRTASNVGS
ncbi:MAG: SpvB/TcaC N-terminal domain-containing protein, partial [Polyangiaceae bacterium]